MRDQMASDPDLEALAPWAFAFPPQGLLPGELMLGLRELACLSRRTKAWLTVLEAEAERRGIRWRPKLGLRDILALSPPALVRLTPPSG